MRVVVLLLLSLGVVACAMFDSAPKPASAPAPHNYYAEGETALARGDLAAAWVAFRSVPENAPDAPNARAALQQLRGKIDSLTDRLLAKAEEAHADGLHAKAVRILADAIAKLAPFGERKSELEKRLSAERAKLKELERDYQRKLENAAERISQGDAPEAYRLLVRAYEMSEDQGFAWSFEDEQRLEFARLQTPAQQQVASRQRETRRKRQTAGATEPPASPVSSDMVALRDQERARQKNVKEMLGRARDLRAQGKAAHAIITLLEAKKKDATNAQVKAELDALESDRVRLVEEYLENADRYMVAQDLTAAAEYYRFILQLEPDNIRARDAIKMHENLEKIKRERSGT